MNKMIKALAKKITVIGEKRFENDFTPVYDRVYANAVKRHSHK